MSVHVSADGVGTLCGERSSRALKAVADGTPLTPTVPRARVYLPGTPMTLEYLFIRLLAEREVQPDIWRTFKWEILRTGVVTTMEHLPRCFPQHYVVSARPTCEGNGMEGCR